MKDFSKKSTKKIDVGVREDLLESLSLN